VLDLAKIESGKAEWHIVGVDLRDVIEESVAATSQLYRERDIGLDLDLPPAVPTILADRDRLIQVMINLLSNASKFCSREAGRVRVALSQERTCLRVDVTDNGIGISPQDQEIIFEKFRQVGDTLTDKPQGTGLGLPICREIIGHCGGRLWVESELGRGATFSFTLPLREEQPEAVGAPSMAHA
jgi:signal transduction histidine kinase